MKATTKKRVQASLGHYPSDAAPSAESSNSDYEP
ncbi:hypothetical protein L914_07106 [Phytophthora nicotianae]|uniref:Uncharacterized protein n=1 Tax=Phytophthora nicotianae TaxID=4792 RepID=W2NIJ0_PHYNI|nr:hypothetical protein L914_07106 [Phytophthora nicotianae]